MHTSCACMHADRQTDRNACLSISCSLNAHRVNSLSEYTRRSWRHPILQSGIYIYIYMYRIYIHICIFIHICIHIYIHIYIHICINIYIHIDTHIYIYIYIFISRMRSQDACSRAVTGPFSIGGPRRRWSPRKGSWRRRLPPPCCRDRPCNFRVSMPPHRYSLSTDMYIL